MIMLRQIKRMLMRATGIAELVKSVEEQNGLLANVALMKLLADEKYSDGKRLSRFGFKVYSQSEEDGCIQEIFRRIGAPSKNFVEIGVSNGRENNTVYLLRLGWKGIWIEGNPDYAREIDKCFINKIRSGALIVSCQYVTRENADNEVGKLAPQPEIDLLSIDVDGNDYHILQAIRSIRPRVIVLEYNGIFAPPIEWVMPYNPQHMWDGSDYYGASLKSYERMLAEKGYSLVGCTINGNNAFFVRTELLGNHFCLDTSAENHYEPQRFWITRAFLAGHRFQRTMLD
jgi:hypothetical protein